MKQNYAKKHSKSGHFHSWLAALLITLAGTYSAQVSYTFTPCGATSSLGPIQTQINATYSTTSLNNLVTSVNGVQHFTVPTAGMYRVSALGAQGGGAGGGYGALIEGDFSFAANEVIRIVVGQQGITLLAEPNSCGGSGGSFVVRSSGNTTTDIVVIAGGGGGSPASYTISRHASTTTSGNWGAGASNTDGAPGTNGNGGNKGISANTQDRAAGGGGFFTDGQSIQQSGFLGAAQGGTAFVNGSYGGSNNTTGVPGGFGGGGAVWTTGHKGGGGGGGFSGGGGGQTNGSNSNTHSGGGGGSFNNGINQSNVVSTSTGDGIVVITELCNVNIVSSSSGTTNPATICSGNSVTLTTNAVSGFLWSSGQTTKTIVVAPTTNTVYSVTGTSSLACTSTGNLSITVSSGVPVLSISNPSNTICAGKTVSLNATGALSYTWTNVGVVNGQTFTPLSTAVYTVTGQNGCGISTANTTITVAPLAVSILASSTLICQGSPVTLTAVAVASTYTWLPSALGGSTTVVAPTANSVYTVSVSDGTCSGTQTVAVATKITPTVNVSATSSVMCEGDQLVISASGANNYTWMPGNLTGNTVTVSPSASTVYVVTGENLNNCSAVNSQIVLVVPSPTINVTASKLLVCAGQTVYLSATGGNGYQWTGGPGTYSNVVTPNATTVYTVTGTHTLNVCTAAKTITINAITYTLTLPTNTEVCVGGSVTVYASGATSYVWNSSSTGGVGVFVLQPPATTTVTLIATTQSLTTSCPVTHTFEVLVNPLPSLTVTATRAVVCKNETNTLTVSGAQTYSWTTTHSGNTFTIKPGANTTYSVAGTDAKGCVSIFNYQAKVSQCSGIDESAMNGSRLMVYPNPNNGTFTVKAESAMDLVLVNELGQELRKFKLSESNNFAYEFKDLKPGIYFVRNEKEAGAVLQKIVVN